MIKGSEIRKADHEIEALLLDRWSPRTMSGEEISHEELMRLFEAARWAPPPGPLRRGDSYVQRQKTVTCYDFVETDGSVQFANVNTSRQILTTSHRRLRLG